MPTVVIRFDTLNLQYCSRGSNPLNHKTECIVTEQGGWKVTASSDCVFRRSFRRSFRRGSIIPLLCTTQSPLENVSVHPEIREAPASDVALDTGASRRILWIICWTFAWFTKVERTDCGHMCCSSMVLRNLGVHFWSSKLSLGWKVGISSFKDEIHCNLLNSNILFYVSVYSCVPPPS